MYGLRHASRVIPEGERPVCQFCEKTLKLATRSAFFKTINTEEHQRETARLLKTAKAWTSVNGTMEDPYWISLWFGDYEGYGKDAQGLPLFCGTYCAVCFAQVQYRSGRRIALVSGKDRRQINREEQQDGKKTQAAD